MIGLTVDLDGVLDITGDFSITQSTNADGTTTTALGIANFSASVEGIAVTDGEGAFVITEAGVAGVVSGHGSRHARRGCGRGHRQRPNQQDRRCR